MPRLHRCFLPNVPLHIIQRGNNRQPCFFTERDYIVYLEKLREYSLQNSIAIHSFVLMTNHVHLVLTPQSPEAPSRLLQTLGRWYVRYINATYRRTGTLWEGRFKASLVDSATYFLTLSRYVELNPVRASIVEHPAKYPWSSYRMNAMGKTIALLTPHPIYQSLGNTPEERQQAYRALFANEIPALALEEIRNATNKAWVLGNDKFRDSIEAQLGFALPPFPRGGNRRSKNLAD